MLHELKATPNKIKIIVIFLKWIIAIARSIYVSYKNFCTYFFFLPKSATWYIG